MIKLEKKLCFIGSKTVRSNLAGFSLLELVVVIALLGIITGVGLPYYQGFTVNLQLQGAARDLASDLRYAQQQAVTTQANHQVAFYISQNFYQVANASTGSLIKSRTIKSPILLESTTLASSTAIFNATGAAISSGNIILSNSNGRHAVIDVKPSGYVQISLSN
ncbi:MAG: GspH/FimT family pseudopilin [Candidatus Buchananbacteria bacterium]